ncbi:hypothetical protein BGZ57DRAFT_575845 [Hyaloscypha finlandica]|nr:hypothetical protein BGZ57DRAFT_575845 [Hyaloscypha finlandica]
MFSAGQNPKHGREEQTLSSHSNSILNSGRMKLGDILRLNFAMALDLLAEIAAQTTIVIHSVRILLQTPRSPCPSDKQLTANGMSTLELARMASDFINLRQFVQVSTGYSNSNQPDGIIEEKIYHLGHCEEKFREITTTVTSLHAFHFPWPYGYAKHLTERLSSQYFSIFPSLSSTKPALAQRYVSAFPTLWTHEYHTYCTRTMFQAPHLEPGHGYHSRTRKPNIRNQPL